MDKNTGHNTAGHRLFPPIEPFARHMMDTGDGHKVYVEQCGNPGGIPVVVFHGGPGGGCSPTMRRFFNPETYHIILFDQRGCGRSKPHASVDNNTTWHLIHDIECIRAHVGVDQWIVFGGSWGATLALIYAQTHPEQVSALVLRGVFLGTEPELEWFYGGGAGKFWPDLWKRFTGLIPEDEQHDLIAAYSKRLFSGLYMEEIKHARAWAAWENALASVQSNGMTGEAPSDYVRAFARLENHYFVNRAFLNADQQILDNMDTIKHIPGHIVQGRLDMICPPQAAVDLKAQWKRAKLELVPMAGHAMSEPPITEALLRVMREFEKKL